MRIKGFILVSSVILLSFLASCTEFRKLQKSSDWEKKYEAAIKYYENEDYYRAGVLFEELLPILRGSQRAEMAHFYYAYSNFHQEQFILASHYFKSFFETFGRSQYAIEANFMYAYSLYKDSPRFTLDQTSTKDAIVALQTFVNRYPKSDYRDQATQIIDELQTKLEKKAYENAKLVYKLRDNRVGSYLKASIVVFETFQNDYPDSQYNEEIRYLVIEAKHLLASRSIESLKAERYRDTIEQYYQFVDMYPSSKFLKKAQSLYEDSLNQLEKIKS
jgi:outer membrane protein assembly factor BamD